MLSHEKIESTRFYNFLKEKKSDIIPENYSFENEKYMSSMFDYLKILYKDILKLKFKIIKNRTKIDFFISDNPLIIYNPFRKTLNGGIQRNYKRY